MTLKEYLHIKEDKFRITFIVGDFWFHHTPECNILINNETKKSWTNITDIEEKPLSLYLNIEPTNLEEHGHIILLIYYEGVEIYCEFVRKVGADELMYDWSIDPNTNGTYKKHLEQIKMY